MLSAVAGVAIGRNEGERLVRCLQSLRGQLACVVYVDSGSTDGSVEMARQLGVDVVALDMARPFTAARARNAGFARVLELMPHAQTVQFVDGDCEVVEGWLESAHAFLAGHPQVAAVCGQRRERYPARSVYNRLCDLEWATPPGPVKACGGDVMIRVEALSAVGGYRDDLIAGEEPELCVRLRAQGWGIHALADAMTLHDANLTRFGQWWRRTARSGYAYAAGAHLHGAPPERHWVWESRRIWLWGLGPAALALGLLPLAGLWAVGMLLVYPLQMVRQFLRLSGTHAERALQAVFQTLSRFPELEGQIRFFRDHWLQRGPRLIEYK